MATGVDEAALREMDRNSVAALVVHGPFPARGILELNTVLANVLAAAHEGDIRLLGVLRNDLARALRAIDELDRFIAACQEAHSINAAVLQAAAKAEAGK